MDLGFDPIRNWDFRFDPIQNWDFGISGPPLHTPIVVKVTIFTICLIFSGWLIRTIQQMISSVRTCRRRRYTRSRLNLSNARHKKIDLKVFVVVIPKEGWACVAAQRP